MKDLVSPSEKHINLGMIMVTLENVRKHSYEINISIFNLNQNGKLSEKFKRRVGNTLDGLLSFWLISTLQYHLSYNNLHHFVSTFHIS